MNPRADHRVPCASQPLFGKILAEIMDSAARQGLRKFDVWQTEFVSSCECAHCAATGKGQIELETDACVQAWREVRQKYPDFELRIFCSLADATPATRRSLQSLPPEVKIEYPYGDRTPFDECAKQGRWVCHWLAPTYHRYSVKPLKAFLADLFAKHWKGVYGYAGQEFSHAALAEWTWNTQGRSEREFCLVWATRAGYAQPERVADWIALMGPLDEYRFPSWSEPCTVLRRWPQDVAGGAAALAKWRHVAEHLANAEKALALADTLGQTNLVAEAKSAHGFYRVVQAGVALARTIDLPASSTNRDAQAVQAAVEELHRAVRGQPASGKAGAEFKEAWFESLTNALSKKEPR